MKKLATIAIAFFLVLSAIPAMAADQAGDTSTFQAFSTLPAAQRDTLTPMTDTELAAIEGGADACSVCSISATVTETSSVTQSNTNSGNVSLSATQSASAAGTDPRARNSATAFISQSNRARVSQSVTIRIN